MNIFRRIVSGFFMVLFLLSNVPAQDAFGNYRLVNLPSPPIRSQVPIRTGIRAPRFLFRFGGIAFDGIAKPQTNRIISSLKFDYLPSQSDGNRLSVTLNGKKTTTQIYDWQLIPIAKFADSKDNVCVTLFGTLGDASEDEKVKENLGQIINYHKAFENTLMGLRLFQLDMLIFSDDAYDLPTEKGKYILGAGELSPDKEANKRGMQIFREQYGDLDDSDSYIISDYNRTTEFDAASVDLDFTGEPSYFLWKLKGQSEFYDETDNQYIEIEKAKTITRRTNPRKFNEKQWLIGQIITEAIKFDQKLGNPDFLPYSASYSLVKTLQTAPGQRRIKLQDQLVEDLAYDLAQLRASLKVVEAQPLPELSARISENTDVIRAINPAVWDAGVNLMRYASIFRYYKQKYPVEWRKFINKINQVPPPTQTVRTPTVMYPQFGE